MTRQEAETALGLTGSYRLTDVDAAYGRLCMRHVHVSRHSPYPAAREEAVKGLIEIQTAYKTLAGKPPPTRISPPKATGKDPIPVRRVTMTGSAKPSTPASRPPCAAEHRGHAATANNSPAGKPGRQVNLGNNGPGPAPRRRWFRSGVIVPVLVTAGLLGFWLTIVINSLLHVPRPW